MLNMKTALTIFALVLVLGGGAVLLSCSSDVDADPAHKVFLTINDGYAEETYRSEAERQIEYSLDPDSGYFLPLSDDEDNVIVSPVSGVTVTYYAKPSRTGGTLTVTWTEDKAAVDFNQYVTIYCLKGVTVNFSFTPSTISKSAMTNLAPEKMVEFSLPSAVGYDLPTTATVGSETIDISSSGVGKIPNYLMTPGATLTVKATYTLTEIKCSVTATNLDYDAPASVSYGATLTVTLTAKTGYSLPDASGIAVTMGSKKVTDFSYSNGKITVSNVKESVSVVTAGKANVYNLIYRYDGEKQTVDFGSSYSKYTYNVPLTLPTSMPAGSDRILDGFKDSSGANITVIKAGTIGDQTITVLFHDDMSMADKTAENFVFIIMCACIGIIALIAVISRK